MARHVVLQASEKYGLNRAYAGATERNQPAAKVDREMNVV